MSTLIREIYSIVSELRKKYPNRSFTPDGHMVGSLGEVYAAEKYGIKLFKNSHPRYDGEINGRKIQIKTTQGKGVEINGEYELLLVLRINDDGEFDEIYNGDGIRPWISLKHRKQTKAGEIYISLKQLAELNENVKPEDKILRVVRNA